MDLYLDSKNHPHIKFKVLLNRWILVNCLIDTGFTGGLTLPEVYLKDSKQKPVSHQDFELADGSIENFPVYSSRVRYKNTVKNISLSFSKTSEAIVGLEFLLGYKLVLDLKRFLVTLD